MVSEPLFLDSILLLVFFVCFKLCFLQISFCVFGHQLFYADLVQFLVFPCLQSFFRCFWISIDWLAACLVLISFGLFLWNSVRQFLQFHCSSRFLFCSSIVGASCRRDSLLSMQIWSLLNRWFHALVCSSFFLLQAGPVLRLVLFSVFYCFCCIFAASNLFICT